MKTYDLSIPGVIDEVAALTAHPENTACKIRLGLYHRFKPLILMEDRLDRLNLLREEGVIAEVEGHKILIRCSSGHIRKIKLEDAVEDPEQPAKETCL